MADDIQAAVAKAKAIAAELERKRKLEQDDSSNKKRKEGNSKRIWIPTTEEKPAPHFTNFLRSRLDDLIQQVNQQLQEPDDEAELTVELSGKGADDKPPLPGIPQEPLHILVQGSHNALDHIEPLLQDLVQQASDAPVQSDVLIQYNAYKTVSVSSYQPSSVAQMIGKTDIQLKPGFLQQVFGVPNHLVGFIIGKGGENIVSMQAKTHCKVTIQKESELQPGQTEREITLQANTQRDIDDCRSIIQKLIAERTQQRMTKEDLKVKDALDQGHAHLVVPVPDADVGLVIGKMGANIRHIQETTGAQVIVPKVAGEDNYRQVSVTHPMESGAHQAKQMIEDILQQKANRNTENGVSDGDRVTREVPVPDKDVGLCIGRGGSVIKYMQSVSKARIQIPSHANPGEMYRIATVTGSAEGVAQAEQMINQIIADQSSANIMSGVPRSDSYAYQQYYGGGQGIQGGNTAEWAAYRAAQAAAAGHTTIARDTNGYQQQSSQGSENASQQPTSDAYYEQYFRYEYYYGEEAARQYYGAWAPPVGTPNPYGINPNGIQAAPASQAAPAPASQAAPAPASSAPSAPLGPTEASGEARETGRRKVSNLPAWMTQN